MEIKEMQPQYLIAGNWKMNTTAEETKQLLQEMQQAGIDPSADVQVLFCPPYLSIPAATQALAGTGVHIGAQDCSPHEKGAYTGDVSAVAIRSIGCSYVLVGHSERREYHGETNASCNSKIKTASANGLTAVYCIGETAAQRDKGETEVVLAAQLQEGLQGLESADSLVIAYEPVWAIGQSAATPEQIKAAHASIRSVLQQLFGDEHGQEVGILYGGSLNAENAQEILSVPNVGGGLIGGASLKPAAFSQIIATAKGLAQ